MRTEASQANALALCLVVGGVFVEGGQSQTELALIEFTNTWRYNAWGTNLPTSPISWTATNYNDSWWSSGPGLLGAEATPEVYPLPILTPIAGRIDGGPLTAYFRTRFDFPSNSTAGVVLVASNLLDDGAIFYLNGTEIQRIRMPVGAINYNTYEDQSYQGAIEVFTVLATNVRWGDNVLAVEVHQASATSNDDVLGMSLSALLPEPIVITNPPVSQTVAEGNPVSFSVEVSGSDPRYQWYTNDRPVLTATQASYVISTPTTNMTGTRVCVVVTNAISALTNCVTLTVLKDIYPPGLVSAVASDASPSNTITLTFTELLLHSTATNPANYTLRLLGTSNTVTVSNVLHSSKAVSLRVGGPNWKWGSNYVLAVSEVADLKTNWIAPPSNQVLVTFPQSLFPFDGVLLYWDWLAADYFLDPPVPLPPDWKLPECDDSDPVLWPGFPGIIYDDNAPPDLPCYGPWPYIDPGLVLSNTTYYIRAHFMAPPTRGPASLRLEYVAVHGAVFYLNGAEIYRYNMPAGQIVQRTTAVSCVSPTCLVSTNIPVTNLRTSDNVLAAEIHRCADTSSTQFYCGVRIRGVIPLLTAQTEIGWLGPGRIRVDWTAPVPGLFVLESAPGLPSGEWTSLGTDSPVEVDIGPGECRFFRVREK